MLVARTGRPGPAPSWPPACRGHRPAPVATRARPSAAGSTVPASGSGWLVVARTRRRGRGHQLDVEHPVDVGGAQLEHLHHPAERGEGVDLGAEPLEHGPAPLGALVDDGEPVLVVGRRVHQQHARPRVLGEVLHGLREELVRQRHALVVDPVHARQVGDVRRAVAGRGGDHGGDRAARSSAPAATARIGHGRSVRSSARPPTRAPAPGPGRLVEASRGRLTMQAT